MLLARIIIAFIITAVPTMLISAVWVLTIGGFDYLEAVRCVPNAAITSLMGFSSIFYATSLDQKEIYEFFNK
jgi:hypothetical protein